MIWMFQPSLPGGTQQQSTLVQTDKTISVSSAETITAGKLTSRWKLITITASQTFSMVMNVYLTLAALTSSGMQQVITLVANFISGGGGPQTFNKILTIA